MRNPTWIQRCLLSKEYLLRLQPIPCSVFSAGKKTMQQEPELPKIPKKPLTPYIQFIMNHRDDIKRKHPVLTNEELRNKLLHMWQNLTFEEKNLWSLKYEREKRDYDLQFKEFSQKLNALTPPDGKKNVIKPKLKSEKELKAVKEKLLKEKENLAKKNLCDSLGKPKSPGNAFTLYLTSVKQDGVQLKNFMHEASVMWKQLSGEEKEIFRQKAKTLQEQYQAKLLEWETKMCSMGRGDLVRSHPKTRLKQKLKES